MGGNHKKHTRMRLLTLRKCLNCSVEQQFSSNLFCTSTSASLPFKSSATLTTTRKDHIDITYQQTRSQVMMNAHIQEIVQLSPTIKGFTIKVDGSVPGSFKCLMRICGRKYWMLRSTAKENLKCSRNSPIKSAM